MPVAHSISPAFHNAAFAAAEFDAVYIPFEVKDLKSFIKRMVHPRTRELDWSMRGLSVTAPHKSAVMESLDWIDPVAREIGAVNTIVVEGDQLRGYNTDAAGFINPLLEKCGDLKGWPCAVIGAGGAARAVVWGLRQRNVEVTVFARDTHSAETLAKEFGAAYQPLSGASFENFKVVVNTTPLGTMGPLQSETPANASQLSGASFVCDIVYNPISTRFLREGEIAGCQTLSGLEMLVAQAEEQFRLWTGAAAPAGVMREVADRALVGGSNNFRVQILVCGVETKTTQRLNSELVGPIFKIEVT